jgi:transcription antitermination factor NusA-like protein
MQSPLCEECLKSKALCDICSKNAEKNNLSKDEIEVLRYVYKLSLKSPSLKDIKIVKVMDHNVLLIITGIGDAAKLVGKGGSVVKQIAKKFKKSIRILEQAPDFKDFIEGLVMPANVNGINTLYRDNEEITRIRVPEFQKSHMLLTPDDFSQVVSQFFKRKAEIVFEV